MFFYDLKYYFIYFYKFFYILKQFSIFKKKIIVANLFHGVLDLRTLECGFSATKTKKPKECSFVSLPFFDCVCIPSQVKNLSRHKLSHNPKRKNWLYFLPLTIISFHQPNIFSPKNFSNKKEQVFTPTLFLLVSKSLD